MKLINLVQNFQSVVDEHSNQIAVIDEQGSLSFGDLFKLAQFVASEISHQLKAINNPIAVYLPKSRNTIIADIGIMYSGNAYMNLDTKSPMPRVQAVIENTKPAIIITDNDNLTKLQTGLANDVQVIKIDSIDQWDSSEKECLMFKQQIDTDPCCIINTSGSTGVPKGVVLNHRSFIDFLSWALETFSYDETKIIGSLSPAIFDIYSFELCLLLHSGSQIILIPDTYKAFPIRILEWLQNYKVSFIFWVPTIMVNIANMGLLDQVNLDRVKLVWFAGEVLPTKHLNYWRRSLKNASFVNLYGPIEITLDCLYYIVDKEFFDDEPLPLGIPCRNTDVMILREDDTVAQIGEHGELCVRGSSLAMGYYNDPEKTSSSFTQNPLQKHYPELIYRTGDSVYMGSDGNIMFVGRKDFQVKHQGYRIELSEVENAVLTLPFIRQACVLYDSPNKKIVLFYESDGDIEYTKIIKSLSGIIPKYMIPTEYNRVKQMPMNTNGKIDRQALITGLL